jgi:AcrR family transcriptional regulator
MLNSVSDHVARRRLSADDRRRQLVSIGLTKLMEKPIQDLSLDEIAAEAGISRGLLFHYFATKNDFYVACVQAAGRRILRNVGPSPDESGEDQVRTMVRAMVEQITRRRSFYLTLVHGATDERVVDVYESVRTVSTDRVLAALELPPERRPVVRAWWAYVEDRALSWSAVPATRRTPALDALVDSCCAALESLLALG